MEIINSYKTKYPEIKAWVRSECVKPRKNDTQDALYAEIVGTTDWLKNLVVENLGQPIDQVSYTLNVAKAVYEIALEEMLEVGLLSIIKGRIIPVSGLVALSASETQAPEATAEFIIGLGQMHAALKLNRVLESVDLPEPYQLAEKANLISHLRLVPSEYARTALLDRFGNYDLKMTSAESLKLTRAVYDYIDLQK